LPVRFAGAIATQNILELSKIFLGRASPNHYVRALAPMLNLTLQLCCRPSLVKNGGCGH
jgi:hypothetical protein